MIYRIQYYHKDGSKGAMIDSNTVEETATTALVALTFDKTIRNIEITKIEED